MPKTLTAADRSALIRLASTMAVGSLERRAILAGLSTASDEVKKVLKEVARHFKKLGMDVDLETRLWVQLNIVDPWEPSAGIKIVPGSDGELEVSLIQGGRAFGSETVSAFGQQSPSARAVIEAVKDVASRGDYTVDRR